MTDLEIILLFVIAMMAFVIVWMACEITARGKERRESQERWCMDAEVINTAHRLIGDQLHSRDLAAERWNAERQQLLDRIQAPSFGELKQAEVRVIKAQQGVKEPAPLEVV